MTSFPPILGLADCPSAQAPLLLMLLLSEKRLAPQIWFEFMLKKKIQIGLQAPICDS